MCPAPVDPLQLEIPRGAMRDYINMTGDAAILVLNPPIGRPCEIRVGRDIGQVQTSAKRRWHFAVEIVVAVWVINKPTALRVCEHVGALAQRDYPLDKHGRWRMDGRDARALIQEATQTLGIKTMEHGPYLRMIRERCALIEDDMQRAWAKGQLAWFNRAYHRHRITDMRPSSFPEARLRLRRAIMRRVVAGYGSAVNADILGEIFPRLHQRTTQ